MLTQLKIRPGQSYDEDIRSYIEFFFGQARPDLSLMRHGAPLLDGNPILFWKLTSRLLLAARPGCMVAFDS